MPVSQQSCFSPTQRKAQGGDVRSKDGGQVLERGVKDKLKIEVTLNHEATGQTGKQKHRSTGDTVWRLHMSLSGAGCPPDKLNIVQHKISIPALQGNSLTSGKWLHVPGNQ